MFGIDHSMSQLALFRPQIRHKNIKDIYRVGASTRPGNGVPSVMIGARLSAQAILEDIKKYNK